MLDDYFGFGVPLAPSVAAATFFGLTEKAVLGVSRSLPRVRGR